ncbi:hypothetical protein [Ornithinimicrobium cerasi]|uniref:hypothetical protein n=1 Tax=Ornithinimicrobium cerasi TaxID=2248773 RepID=UPI00137AE25C|nr:hypothetical protein [Ornithinimicrobium cerasi]
MPANVLFCVAATAVLVSGCGGGAAGLARSMGTSADQLFPHLDTAASRVGQSTDDFAKSRQQWIDDAAAAYRTVPGELREEACSRLTEWFLATLAGDGARVEQAVGQTASLVPQLQADGEGQALASQLQAEIDNSATGESTVLSVGVLKAAVCKAASA